MTRVALIALSLSLLVTGPSAARGRKAAPNVLALSDRARARLSPQRKQRAIRAYGLQTMALRRSFVARHKPTYKFEIPRERTPHAIRNQRSSGRCWLFATDNVLQSKLFAKGINPQNLSTSFLNYHYLRRQAHTLLRKAAKGRVPRDLKLGLAIREGGFSTWALHLVRRHGLVPEQAMPTTADGAKSALYRTQLQTLVAAAVRDMRRATSGERRAIAKRTMKQVDRLLQATVGRPPRSFVVDGKRYTPKTYARDRLALGASDLDYVMLTHDPRSGWNRRNSHNFSSRGMPPLQTYNVSMKTMVDAVKATLHTGEAVYFSSNVSTGHPFRAGTGEHDPPAAKGILSIKAFNYAPYAPLAKLSKRDRLKAKITPTNHAMAITGYDPGRKPGSVLKWKVDNSWGAARGDRGHFHMYHDFFAHYVTRVVVPRSAVPAQLLQQIDARAARAKKPKRRSRRRRRWTPTRKRALVLQVLGGKLSVAQAASRHGLSERTVASWRSRALQAMATGLGSN